jgi:hypothetical protein
MTLLGYKAASTSAGSLVEQALRQKKLQELEDAGVPVKYRVDLAKKNFLAVKG